jgi:hypothetical protein
MKSLPLAAILIVVIPACSIEPTVHPLNTAPIPDNVRYLEACSSLANTLCSAVSALSGDGGRERGAACIAYIDKSGKRVEHCGSLPVTPP